MVGTNEIMRRLYVDPPAHAIVAFARREEPNPGSRSHPAGPPSALERMIAARQACFCEALRSLVIASSRPRTDRVIVMKIPVRMRQTRTATETEESQSELFCQAKTTSECYSLGARIRRFQDVWRD